MKVYVLKREQILPVNLEEAWSFFSSPSNLQEITPDNVSFEIISELPDNMYQGMIIMYKISPFLNIPFTWVTVINHIHKPKMFIDEQITGPYKLWHHQHIFEEVEGGVKMTDLVHYGMSFGIFGRIAHKLFVKKQLESIFNYRNDYLQKKFKNK